MLGLWSTATSSIKMLLTHFILVTALATVLIAPLPNRVNRAGIPTLGSFFERVSTLLRALERFTEHHDLSQPRQLSNSSLRTLEEMWETLEVVFRHFQRLEDDLPPQLHSPVSNALHETLDFLRRVLETIVSDNRYLRRSCMCCRDCLCALRLPLSAVFSIRWCSHYRYHQVPRRTGQPAEVACSYSDTCASHSCTSKSTFLKIMGGSGNPALISCCLLFVCLCLTKHFSLYVDALNVDLDVDCVPDISDMVDYDPVTQTSARCEKMKREKQKAKDQCQANLADAQHNLEACLTASDFKPCVCPPPVECEDDVKAMPCRDADDMFFRRLVRHLVNVIQKKAPESGQVEAQMEIHLTSHDWKKLQSFADGKDDYRRADIHDVMVGMTMNIFYFNQTSIMEWLGEQVNLKSPAAILLTVSVTVLCLVFGVGMYSDFYWNRRFIFCLLTSIFVISVIWNWIYLYQEETIKRYRNAQKYEKIPANCMPHKMTWVQALQEWFSSMTSIRKDECFEYHRIYQVDPLFDIPPTRALSVTVSSLFVDNFKYFGRAVSEFHAEIFRDLPIWAALPALVSCYVFGFFALYAYIAAPRRVLRERPVLQQVRRGPPALGAAREHNLPIAEHIGEEDPHPGDGYREGDRIENILPPTLPVAREEKKKPSKQRGSPKKPPPGNQHRPRGAVGGRTHDQRGVDRDEDEEGQELFPGVKEVDDDSVQPLERGHEAGQSGLGPAVRPKTKPPGQTFQRPADGNDADTSSSDSIETVQSKPRPRDFGDSRPSRQIDRTTSIGDSDSGALVSHPYSEKSDGESLVGSGIGSILLDQVARDTPVGHQASADDEETTASSNIPTGYTTPSSIGSPDDISVISQSPENTNSATYDFISTSSFGLSGEQPPGLAPEEVRAEQVEEDFEDDFVVLQTEK